MIWTWKNIFFIAAFVIILYLIGVLSIYIFINSIIFNTERTSKYKFNYSHQREEILINSPDMNIIHAVYCKPKEKEKAIVLYLHGTQNNLNQHILEADIFTSRSLSVLIPDFRGFGKSSGSVSENNLNEDAVSCMEWIRKRFREDSVIIYAKDFSSSAACYLATLFPCRFIVLENPVYSLRNWMRDQFPVLALPYELKYDFNTFEYLPNCISPVIIIQSKSNAYCNTNDIIKLQYLLKDPQGLIYLDNAKDEPIRDLEKYQATLDLLFNF